MTMAEQSHFPLVIEFSGGLEMLFGNTRTLSLQVPARDAQGVAITAGWLVKYLCEEIMIDARKDMLVLDGHVRPGVLVLINDMDWELEGDAAYVLQPNDNILFISTLHGG